MIDRSHCLWEFIFEDFILIEDDLFLLIFKEVLDFRDINLLIRFLLIFGLQELHFHVPLRTRTELGIANSITDSLKSQTFQTE